MQLLNDEILVPKELILLEQKIKMSNNVTY